MEGIKWYQVDVLADEASLQESFDELCSTAKSKLGEEPRPLQDALEIFRQFQSNPETTPIWVVRERIANAYHVVAHKLPLEHAEDIKRYSSSAISLYVQLSAAKYMRSIEDSAHDYLKSALRELPANHVNSSETLTELNRLFADAFRPLDLPSQIKSAILTEVGTFYTDFLTKLIDSKRNSEIQGYIDSNIADILDISGLSSERAITWLSACEKYHSTLFKQISSRKIMSEDLHSTIFSTVNSLEFVAAADQSDYDVTAELLRPAVMLIRKQLLAGLDDLLKIREPYIQDGQLSKGYNLPSRTVYAFANSFEQASRNPRLATEALEKIFVENPLPKIKEAYAYALIQSGNLQAGERHLESLYKSRQYDSVTLWNLACLNYRRGQIQQSFDILLTNKGDILSDDAIRTVLIGLALKLNKLEFIVDVHGMLLDIKLLALAYVLAVEQKDQNAAKTCLEVLRNIAGDQKLPHIPSVTDVLNERELKQLYADFDRLGLVEQGIKWFTARCEKQQKYGPNWKYLALLQESNGQVQEAYIANKQVLILTCLNPRLKKWDKDTIVKEIFAFCLRHSLIDEGKELLGISKSHIAPEFLVEWAPKFGLIIENDNNGEPPQKLDQSVNFTRLYTLSNELRRIRNVQELFNRLHVFDEYSENLSKAYAKEYNALDGIIKNIRTLLSDYKIKKSRADRQEISRSFSGQLIGLTEKANQSNSLDFRETVVPLIQMLNGIRDDISKRADLVPQLIIEFLSDKLTASRKRTAIAIRLKNQSPVEMHNIVTEMYSKRGNYEISEPTFRRVEYLGAEESEIISFYVTKSDNALEGGGEEFQVNATYSTQDASNITLDAPIMRKLEETDFAMFPPRYYPGKPLTITNKRNFYGREKEIQCILRSFFGGEQHQLLFLDGIRRVGKSTILNHLEATLPSNMIYVLMDMMGDFKPKQENYSTIKLFRAMANKIREAVLKKFPAVEIPQINDEFDKDPHEAFNAFFISTYNAVPAQKLLLVIDEMQDLLEAIAAQQKTGQGVDITCLDVLRDLYQKEKCLFIFTGSVRYHKLIGIVDHPLLGAPEKLEISFIDEESSRNAIQNPIREDGAIFIEESASLLWKMVHGYPWLLQVIGEQCLNILNEEERWAILPIDIEKVANKLLSSERHFVYWFPRKYLKLEDADVLSVILRKQEKPGSGLRTQEIRWALPKHPIATIDKSLSRLIDHQILERALPDDLHRIKGALLERKLLTELQDKKRILVGGEETFDKGKCSIIVDHENFILCQTGGRSDIAGTRIRELYDQLMTKAAEEYGKLGELYSCADWNLPAWRIHQDSIPTIYNLKRAMWKHTEGKDGADASVFISTFSAINDPYVSMIVIVADDHIYADLIRLGKKEGKEMFVWGTRRMHSDLRSAAGAEYCKNLEDILRT